MPKVNIDLRKLRHLIALARNRSFSRAAAELHLTQPALSRSIADLERELGERLFDRTPEGVIPTAFGLPIIDQACDVLAEADRFSRSVLARTSGDIGVLNFGAGPLVAALAFAEVLAQMAHTHPQLLVKAAIAPGKALAEAVRAGRIEFAVFAEPLLTDRRGLDVEPIETVEIGYLVRCDHPLAHGEPVAFTDLAPFPIASGTEQGVNGAVAAIGASDFPPTLQCDDFSILAQVTCNSDAVWLTAAPLAQQHRQLVLLDVNDGPVRHLRLVMVSEAGRTPSPAAREARQLIRSSIALGQRGAYAQSDDVN